jgi:hypothetical protein
MTYSNPLKLNHCRQVSLRVLLALALAIPLVASALVAPVQAQNEINYEHYRALARASDRIDHMTKFEPLNGEAGMFIALAERFGTVQVARVTARGVERVWKSIQLSGVPEEVLVADLQGDGFDDSLVCRTSNGKVYVWSLDGYGLIWESLPGEYTSIPCFTVANMDEDPANEIVLLADLRLIYIDGVTFNKQFSGINDYVATQIRCGDVDGDQRVEVVLNSGQVVDSVSGDIEWEDEPFFEKIELFDIDGDGMPEILTEPLQGGALKVFDADYRSEVRFQ